MATDPVVLPFVASNPNYRVGTTLNNVTYIFDVRWSTREGAWYFDIRDEDESMIRAGVKIVLGALLGRRSADARFPPGAFETFDLTYTGREAGLDDIGTRVVVLYYSPEALAAL